MRAETLGREERPFDVRSDDAGEGSVRRYRAKRFVKRALRCRDEGRLIRGDAAFEERGARHLVVGRRGREEVDAAVAVHLEVDETRHGDAAARGGREPDRGDDTVDNVDVTGD